MIDKAVIVCVDYSDFLSITLPYNRHHFKEVHVITTLTDAETARVAVANHAEIWRTDLFYAKGADFNKWSALDSCLDRIGRKGWICLLDADVLWPKALPPNQLEIGKIYTPLRHMFEDLNESIPEESDWGKYPIHKNTGEWAGYSQLFHARDPVLPKGHWHETNWRHAGCADSIFQARWSKADKVRPPFNCLHLGSAGVNWCGRVTPMLTGGFPEEAGERHVKLTNYLRTRKLVADPSKKFDHEKLM